MKVSYVKVTDAKSGKLKRYEDGKGRAIAVVINGKLQVTTRGVDEGLIISNGKLCYIDSGNLAVLD